MAWTGPRTWVVGELVDAAILNAHIRDNWTAWSTHVHGGSGGDGAIQLVGVDSINYDHISTPSAPGSGKLILYSKSGQPFFRNESAGEVGLNYEADGHGHT